MPSGFLALAERLSGRQTSCVCVNGMLVDMERVKMPLPDGPPPQTPLTKRAKLSGQIAAQMERQQQGQQSVSQLGSVPMSDPPDLHQSLSPVLSPITGIGFSQLSSIPDTPSPLRQATMGTIDTVISSQSDYETNTIIQDEDPDVDEVLSPFVFENPDVTLALFRHVACVEGHRASLDLPPQIHKVLEKHDDLLAPYQNRYTARSRACTVRSRSYTLAARPGTLTHTLCALRVCKLKSTPQTLQCRLCRKPLSRLEGREKVLPL